jgi:hypothetical protein
MYRVLTLSHIKSKIDRSTFKLPLLVCAIRNVSFASRLDLACHHVSLFFACKYWCASLRPYLTSLETSIDRCAHQPSAQQEPELTADQETVLLWAVGLLSTWHDGSAECYYTYWQHVEKVWFHHFPECSIVFGNDRAPESLDEDERTMLNLHICARRKVRRL